ncbi:hypothetical protein BC831DRAFT_440341 [Entophlyctis helioformis]|nr:hypothetical protein BC831DRAFT_440341 [Entophlyctis helioformis]
MVVLTESQILAKAKGSRVMSAKDLGIIKSINLWGNDLTDVSILSSMPQLEVLSLAVNKLTSLSIFTALPALKELYMRQNLISDPRELLHLAALPSLRILWLVDNPVAALPEYRNLVLRILPALEKLDDAAITEDERDEAFLSGMPTMQELDGLYQRLAASTAGSAGGPQGVAPGTPTRTASQGRLPTASAGGQPLQSPTPSRRSNAPADYLPPTRSTDKLNVGISGTGDDYQDAFTVHQSPTSQRNSQSGSRPSVAEQRALTGGSGPSASTDAAKRPPWLRSEMEPAAIKQSIRDAGADVSPSSSTQLEDDALSPTFATLHSQSSRFPPAPTPASVSALHAQQAYPPYPQQAGQIQSQSDSPTPGTRRGSGQTNILFAVLSLIKELDPVSLKMVREEIDKISTARRPY